MDNNMNEELTKQEEFLEVYEDKKAFTQKALSTKVVFVVVCVLLIAMILKGIYDYSPAFNDTVTEFSDTAPRVGNNIYGYIDVPEGFVMTGSFNPEDTNYAGGADGIAEGVQLKNEDGTMYLVVSLLTPDKKREDYIGLGDGLCQAYNKKGVVTNVEDVFGRVTEDLLTSNVLGMEADGLMAESGFVDVNGMKGMSTKWKGMRAGKEYQYQTYIIENPEREGVFHCVTAIFTSGNEKCVDYVQTFSLSGNEPRAKQFVGVGDRVGSETTGYINIPKGFKEYKGSWFYEMVDSLEKDVDLTYYASETAGETDTPLFEGMVLSSFPKGDMYDGNPEAYMENNLQELYGSFDVLDYLDMSSVKLQGDNREFGAEAFLGVMQQTLGMEGQLTSQPATVDGQQGYRVTWSGRGSVDRTEIHLSFYILESSKDSDMVYILGAKERTAEGQFWQYLDSFRASDK